MRGWLGFEGAGLERMEGAGLAEELARAGAIGLEHILDFKDFRSLDIEVLEGSAVILVIVFCFEFVEFVFSLFKSSGLALGLSRFGSSLSSDSSLAPKVISFSNLLKFSSSLSSFSRSKLSFSGEVSGYFAID